VKTPHILLIEDEPGLVITLTDRLQMHGYAVENLADGQAGLAAAMAGSYDLILLDVMLPNLNGFEICRKLRAAGRNTPVLMLTARGQMVDKIHGLKIGADDYMTKPFEVMELLARIEALLRRAGRAPEPQDAETIAFGAAQVDFKRSEARLKGRVVNLSAREFHLLRYLAGHAGEVITRDRLLEEVWGFNHIPFTRTVDVHITWLRQKLEENPKYPRHIVTVRGTGYKFVP
jgi:two-component system alkaline phosphatase synthesis response regulator PhoP